MYFDLLYINIYCYLYDIYKGSRKITSKGESFISLVEKSTHKSKARVWLDMVHCYLKFGATFKEYYNLNFYERSEENRATFMTTGSNIRALKALNNKSLNYIYINKQEFNHIYSDFLNREWISLNDGFDKVKLFFNQHDKVIIKLNNGDSGKGIFVIENSNTFDNQKIKNIINKYNNSLAEEVLYNQKAINELNDSSLNTIRIITVLKENTVNILFAGIRVGSRGCIVDNISMGGRIAPIDIETGRISGSFCYKKSAVCGQATSEDNKVGFQIPEWLKIIEFTERVARVVPCMRYMAWDIALSSKGPALIEGNHSSGNTINQVHLNRNEDGLKAKLDKWLK